MMMELLQLVIYGVVLGSIITLGAIGASMLFGILRFAHFAHGDLMAVGAYVALAFVTGLSFPLWAAVPFAIAATILTAITVDRLVYKHLRRKNPVILLISSFGIALILRSLIQIIWGPGTHVYQKGIQMPYRFGEIVIKPNHIWIVGGSILLVVAVHLFLSKTKMGKAMRAMADNMDLALISGIPAERVVMWTWAVGGALAAMAGIFLGMDTRLHPEMGWHVMLAIFSAAILGGFGKPYGAILGGLIIGVSMEVSTYFINPSYKHAVGFAIMVGMLIVRPEGLLGSKR